jgi:hypothetical protein
MHDRSRVHVTMVQLPALNTPQFEWSRSRMPRQPQPVPPIFQPEVAAEAIVWASGIRRRQVMLGWRTLKAFIGNVVAPRYIDRYLAQAGYELQQTDEPVSPHRPDNLYRPVPGDRGAHGRFDARAYSFSAQWWASRHRGLVAGLALAVDLATVCSRGQRASSTRNTAA